jgi:hypothetical protein
MQENNDTVSLEKSGSVFHFSALVPMKGREIYHPEPLGTTRATVVILLLTDSEFRVIFNSEPTLSRGTGKPVLCFVVGQDGNSRTAVRQGNLGVILAETKEERALLPTEKGKQVTFWFSFDVDVGVAAFRLGNQPGSDSTLFVVPDWRGCFEKANCQLFIGLVNWEQQLQLNLVAYHTSALRLNNFPDKFNDNKTMKPFHGVTCICRVNEISHGAFVARALIQAQEMLKATGPIVGGCFSFLPPDSFHMTLAGLVTSKNRLTVCPQIQGDMGQVGEELRQRSKEVMAMAASNVIYMKMEGVSLDNSLLVRLQPYEEKTAAAIAAWRDLMYRRVGEFRCTNYYY